MPAAKSEIENNKPAQPDSSPTIDPNSPGDPSLPVPPDEMPPEKIEAPGNASSQEPIDENPHPPKTYV